MFGSYFGNYLVNKGELDEGQLIDIIESRGGEYQKFVNALIDRKIYSPDEINQKIDEYQKEMNYTDNDMQALKDEDIDKIIDLFTKDDEGITNIHKLYISSIIKNAIRFLSKNVRIDSITMLKHEDVAAGVEQQLFGDQLMYTSLFGEKDTILGIASVFGGEDFVSVNIEALDAVGEFLNVCNGIFVSELSKIGIELDLQPPMVFAENHVALTDGLAYIISIYIAGKQVKFIFSVDAEVFIK